MPPVFVPMGFDAEAEKTVLGFGSKHFAMRYTIVV